MKDTNDSPPPPLAGGGWGEGAVPWGSCAPPPNPLPQGEGEEWPLLPIHPYALSARSMYPALRTVWINGVGNGLSTFCRSRDTCTSITLVCGSK